MRNKIIASVLLGISLSAFSFEKSKMKKSEQISYAENVSKNIRRDLWRSGHESVESSQAKITSKAFIDEYVKSENNESYEDFLRPEEIASLYKCHYSKSCVVIHFYVGGSYWGGDGEESCFVLLNTEKESHELIRHLIYAE